MDAAAFDAPRKAWDHLRRGELDGADSNVVAAGIVAAGAVVWAGGALLLSRFMSDVAGAWNAVWGVAGIAFVGSFAIPTPGATTALFTTLAHEPGLAVAAVIGATLGATLGAIFLLLAGKALRQKLKRKATKGPVARFILGSASRLVHDFTYVGIVVLLAIPFVPRPVVLYSASLVELDHRFLILAIAAGHLVRFAVFMAFIAGLIAA